MFGSSLIPTQVTCIFLGVGSIQSSYAPNLCSSGVSVLDAVPISYREIELMQRASITCFSLVWATMDGVPRPNYIYHTLWPRAGAEFCMLGALNGLPTWPDSPRTNGGLVEV